MSTVNAYLARGKAALSSGDVGRVERTCQEILDVFGEEVPELGEASSLGQMMEILVAWQDRRDVALYGASASGSIGEAIRELQEALLADLTASEVQELYDRIDEVYAARYRERYTSGLVNSSARDTAGEPSRIDDAQTLLRIDKLRFFRDEELRGRADRPRGV